MRYRALFFLISFVVIIPGVYSLLTHGLKLGIDFTGGTTFVWQSESLNQTTLQEALIDQGIEPKEITQDSSTWEVTTTPVSSQSYQDLTMTLSDANITELEYNTIGPSVGRELVEKTISAIILASISILLYVAYRFRNIKFGVSAILAMLHDSLILLGTFSLLGYYQGVEVDTLFVTALLTILSFSVHDTIVVYDRIRELGHKHAHLGFENIVNRAVVETMGRSINNSMTIIFMLLSMYLMGGDTTRWFIFALLIGTISGTYSSTFTAAPLLLVWDKLVSRKK
jgi:preprotein translocase subunit SecF